MDAAIKLNSSEYETEPSILAPVIDIRIKTMTKKFVLQKLPVPPSVNALYRDRFTQGVRVAGRAKTLAYLEYENLVREWRLTTLSEANKAKTMINGMLETQALRVGYSFHFPASEIMTKAGSPKKNDISNRLKALDDSVTKLVLDCDDSLFWECSGIQKFANPTLKQAYVDIVLEVIDLEMTFFVSQFDQSINTDQNKSKPVRHTRNSTLRDGVVVKDDFPSWSSLFKIYPLKNIHIALCHDSLHLIPRNSLIR